MEMMFGYLSISPETPTSSSSPRLKVARRLAAHFGLREITLNEVSKVVSFAPKRTDSDTKRINVYYSTQTVGTCVKHPKRGRTQLFRKDVSEKDLARIFENPRAHTGDGYYKRSDASLHKTEAKSKQSAVGSLKEELVKEIADIGKDEMDALQELAARIKWLDTRKKQLQSQLKHVEDNEKRTEEQRAKEQRLAEEKRIERIEEIQRKRAELHRAKERREAKYRDRGYVYVVSERIVDGAGSKLEVLNSFNLNTWDFALGPRGSVVTVDDCGYSLWNGVPQGLDRKLRHRNPKLSPADCVAVGANNEWFVQFADGKCAWNGCSDGMCAFLENCSQVTAVSFLAGNGYAVLTKDGIGHYTANDSLNGILKSASKMADFISISYDEAAFFIRVPNGKYVIHGASDALNSALSTLTEEYIIKKVVFGVSRNYWVVQCSHKDTTGDLQFSASVWT